MEENYILNRKLISLKKSVSTPVDLDKTIGNIENCSFKVEHNSIAPLNITFKFEGENGVSLEHFAANVGNHVPFTIILVVNSAISFNKLEIKAEADIAIGLTITEEVLVY